MKISVKISDGGVTVDQIVEAASIEQASDMIEAQMRKTESAFDAEYQRHEWDGGIIEGTAVYSLHDGGQDSTGRARVVIEAAPPQSVIARWDAADWDEERMVARAYRYEDAETREPITLTEEQAPMYAWGQCQDDLTGGSQAGEYRG